MKEKIEWMAGEVSGDFHESVTHVIAGKVQSPKYRAAMKLGKHLLSPKFIDSLMEINKRQ